MKRQARMGENICQTHISERGLVFKTYTKLLKLNNKTQFLEYGPQI